MQWMKARWLKMNNPLRKEAVVPEETEANQLSSHSRMWLQQNSVRETKHSVIGSEAKGTRETFR
jgi:hypothetical protein